MLLNMHLARDSLPASLRDMSLDKAELVAVFLECLLYGKYISNPLERPRFMSGVLCNRD